MPIRLKPGTYSHYCSIVRAKLTNLMLIISRSTDFRSLKLLSKLLFNTLTLAGSEQSFDKITAQHYDHVCSTKDNFTSFENNSVSCNHQTGTTIEIKTSKSAIQQIILIPFEDDMFAEKSDLITRSVTIIL